jgi:hypothetical protein
MRILILEIISIKRGEMFKSRSSRDVSLEIIGKSGTVVR